MSNKYLPDAEAKLIPYEQARSPGRTSVIVEEKNTAYPHYLLTYRREHDG